MTRRLHRCLACEPEELTAQNRFPQIRGLTRHDDRVCARCRRRGVTHRGGELLVPIDIRIPPTLRLFKFPPADPGAPTASEIADSLDLSCYLADDPIPGRYA